ncbi:unnamed protein product [Scytosiphon promiscuus]
MNSAREGAPSAPSTEFDAHAQHSRGLARKITCSVVSIVTLGGIIIIALQVLLTFQAREEWASVINESMEEAEGDNLLKLARAKAGFVSENFDRVIESVLQLQSFAEGALAEAPEAMTVEAYLALNSGLEENVNETFDHSVWFIPNRSPDQVLAAGSSLEGLLDRSSLMDASFRGMQRQHDLVYLAVMDDPSAPDTSKINFQSYPGRSVSSYVNFTNDRECAKEYAGDDSVEVDYEPRCRPWYTRVVEDNIMGVSITNPYADASSDDSTISAAAPVFDSSLRMMGVIGLDIEPAGLNSSFTDLQVIGNEGYAYLLAPADGEGEERQVAFHKDLLVTQNRSSIYELDADLDKDEFGSILDAMDVECEGSRFYSRDDGKRWLLAWSHVDVGSLSSSASPPSSSSSLATSCSADDFIAVVTVSEEKILEASSNTEKEIRRVVILAILIMALVLLVIGCAMGCVAQFVASGITQPVNQLIDVVHSLNKLDFSRQAAGTWMVNDTFSPEVEELMEAFKSMSTVVKFANTTLASGEIAAAKALYVEALLLFTKLGNSRGVGIVNNNLGNVNAMEAAELVSEAARESDPARVKELVETAEGCYADAATNYKLAIGDTEMRCAAANQQDGGGSPSSTMYDGVDGREFGRDVEAHEPRLTEVEMNDDGDTSVAALYRQLADRKFNFALCLAAKGNSSVVMGGRSDPNAIDNARALLRQCIDLTFSSFLGDGSGESNVNVAKNDERRFGYPLQLSALEREQEGRSREAIRALEEAERAIESYDSRGTDDRPAATIVGATVAPPETSVTILRQRLLEAWGTHWVAAGYPEGAIDKYTQAVIGTGDIMDPDVVKTCLLGLRGLVSKDGDLGLSFSSEMLLALGLPSGAGQSPETLIAAIDSALARVAKEETLMVTKVAGDPRRAGEKTTVDLCFVMDCTGSMQSWIDLAKDKLLDIIVQAKKDVTSISVRVAFVGYRDFGDKRQYEGPIDFHKEDELPKLLAKLKKIKAYGGNDIPEDLAGGLHLATGLDWRGDTRLCILIADAPCHGSDYHRGIVDNYPKGCPKGRQPSRLLFTLQNEIGADLYFVRITQYTDKMISVFQNIMSAMWALNPAKKPQQGPPRKRPDIVVHNLGSDDNRFLEVVVESVRRSMKQKFKFGTYE